MAGFSAGAGGYSIPLQTLRDACVVKRIGITLFNGFALFEAATLVDLFRSANSLCDTLRISGARYDVHLLMVSGGKVSSSAPVSVFTSSATDIEHCDHANSFHALFLVSDMDSPNPVSGDRFITWLRCLDGRSGQAFPIVEGRLFLDPMGFPDTFRRLRRGGNTNIAFRTRFDLPDPLVTRTSVNAALAMIEEDFGIEVAREITDVVKMHFETQFTAAQKRRVIDSVSEKIQSSAQWLKINCAKAITIEEAALFVSMSERNFLRRFKMEMGVTPSDYLLFLRIDQCCRLLSETDISVDKIARRCGMRGGGQLSKVFRRCLGVTPTEYRASKRPLSPA